MALFGAAHFSRKYLSILIPLAAMWVSDLLLNNLVYASLYPDFYSGFSWFGNLWVYASFVLIAGLGFLLLKKVNLQNLLGASLLASIAFFLITNFGAWAINPMYPKTAAGLSAAYISGIPFFWNTMAGDLFFTAVLFGSYALITRNYPLLKTENA
ncbi:MAG: hypothetical protein DHS20C18_09940 [Saprospiraceae bacterium]|nr:MAG: hypothetical protein DHS20C18_09940 [Saprospiraceae bacterium]